MIANVTYIPRKCGELQMEGYPVARVQIDYHAYDKKFNATCLELWGCGKMASTPEGAVRQLVQDMAVIVKIDIVSA
jgi:hypothetical protein